MKYKLKDIFDLQMGKTPSRNNSEYWNSEDYKWISIADLSKTEKYISDTKEYLSKSAVEESGIKIIPANTVVMSFKLSIGKTAITAEDMYSNEAIMAFHDKHVVDVLPEYIFYMFKYRNWEEGSNKAVMGKTLNKATLSEVEIEICPIEEQREIVNILDKMMSILNGRENELSLLDNLIKARFVELFGDPMINPKGFPVKTIEEVSVLNKGITYSPEDVADEGMIVLRSSNIKGNVFDLEDLVKITKKISPDKYVQENDILMCNRNGSARLVGKVAMIPKLDENMTFGTFMTTVRSDIYEYLFAFFQMDAFREQIKFQTAVAINQISLPLLASVKVPVPPRELIDEFAAFTKQIDKSKVAVQKALDETQVLFDSLMQKYFG